MSKTRQPPKRRGRPPAGQHGAAVQDYPRLSARLPSADYLTLSALAAMYGEPIHKMIAILANEHVSQLPAAKRRAFEELKQTRGSIDHLKAKHRRTARETD